MLIKKNHFAKFPSVYYVMYVFINMISFTLSYLNFEIISKTCFIVLTEP